MKTFKDLKFKPHPIMDGLQARLKFENGYEVSVVRHKINYSASPFDIFAMKMCADNPNYGSYTDNENEWELAVFHNDHICYNTPVTDDVIGHLLDKDVTKVMAKVQRLKKKLNCSHGRP